MDIKRLELDKILASVSEYAVLDGGKRNIRNCAPSTDLNDVRGLLARTAECDKLLYQYGVRKIEYFGELNDLITRAQKGSTLSCAELLSANALLRSARVAYENIAKIDAAEIVLMRDMAEKLYFDKNLEQDITEKIISDEELSDYASDRLFTIRSRIRSLNEKIRSKLSDYLSRDAQ